ncbi:unnamed protein product [Caenorhabditis nigoni]
MSNLTCGSRIDFERFTSYNFIFSLIVGSSAVVSTYVTTVMALYAIAKRSIFEMSTKLLLYQILFNAVLYQSAYLYEVIQLFYKSFFKLDQPCELLKTEEDCFLHFNVLIISTSAMIYGKTGLMLERACATFLKSCNKSIRLRISLAIFICVLVLSSQTGLMLTWDDPLDGPAYACYVVPKKSVPRATRFFVVCTILILINMLLLFLIVRHNKRFQYANRFSVNERFHKHQVIESTTTICILNAVLFFLVLTYTIGIGVLLNIKSILSSYWFTAIISWVYTTPYMALAIPVILIVRIKSSRATRIQLISVISKTQQTQDDHMNQMKKMWE